MITTFISIQSHETKIVGKWIIENGRLVADSFAERIDYLIANELIELGRSSDGWSVLYFDKNDSRYWELNYPDSGEHGSGAPCLELLSHDYVLQKFQISGS